MFVRYLQESDLIERGFSISSNTTNLHPESFVKRLFNERSGISTMMTVWVSDNMYNFRIITERESTILRGSFSKKEELDALLEQYFEEDYISFLERKTGKRYDLLEKAILKKNIKPLPLDFYDISAAYIINQNTQDKRNGVI